MSYQRVIPRDFFNEAKLLKCMGHLSLKILDGLTPVHMDIDGDGAAFKIKLLPEGTLIVSNYTVIVDGRTPSFFTTYNSKANFPFYCSVWDSEEILVFTEEGEFTKEFIEFCKTITDV